MIIKMLDAAKVITYARIKSVHFRMSMVMQTILDGTCSKRLNIATVVCNLQTVYNVQLKS